MIWYECTCNGRSRGDDHCSHCDHWIVLWRGVSWMVGCSVCGVASRSSLMVCVLWGSLVLIVSLWSLMILVGCSCCGLCSILLCEWPVLWL